jgi:tripartite-type tricarboxylate transporter receptor subunit TctC
VRNNERRETKVETPPIVSKSRRTQRRLIEARLRGHPPGVKASELPRRQFLHLAAGAAALPSISRIARAQTYPTKPVSVIVPWAPGGVADLFARLLGQWLSERLRRPFIIDNRSGAAGNIGTEAVVRASPDGYTLLLVTAVNAINATPYEKLNFNFIRDIAPVASIAVTPGVMVVSPLFPAKTVPEFIAHAKAEAGKITMATSGVGSNNHIYGELFKMAAAVDLVAVPYRGEGPALSDLLGGQVQVMFSNLPAAIEYMRAGKLRPLAVTTAKRSEALPHVPTVGEFLPGYEASSWFGVGVPKKTSAEIVGRLNGEINAFLTDPQLKARFADLGAEVLAGSPDDFGKLIAEDTEKWGRVIQAANLKVQ